MRLTLTLAITCFTVLGANAQSITLSNTGYTHLIGDDTTRAIDTASMSIASLAIPHSNYTWDLTAAPYTSGSTIFTMSNPSASFPGTSYGQSIIYNFSALSYNDTAMVQVSNSGIARIGESLGHQKNSLAMLTGGANDSLVFPTQNIMYSGGAYNLVKFPATINSTWSSSYMANTAFNLTLAAAFLNNTPGVRRSYFTMNDTVVGYGFMKVNDYTGTASGLNPVLQVRETYSVKDSFFLNGAPAPGTLLASFGLSQGMVTTDYRLYFYRQGETWPLTSVTYTDAAMTKSKSSNIYVHTQRLTSSAAVHGLFADKDVQIYPNPVVNNELNVNLPSGNSMWNYELTNVMGQKVTTASLQTVSGKTTISLPATLQPGTYFLALRSNDGSVVVKQLSVN